MFPLRGGAAVLAEDGAEQAKFLAHREANGGVPRASTAHQSREIKLPHPHASKY